ncbi:MAG: hypothetical protein HY769_07425 [Candidatus Stahlbacteria bacterium]|nr:hypothetical protein [Candidatus Stahlbacteria bacterium]
MAKYRPCGLIQSISGSVGDVTFSSWKGVPRISKRIRKQCIPNTLPQRRIRHIFSYLSPVWRDLSFQDWALWSDYAKRYNKVKPLCMSGSVSTIRSKMSGFNVYVALNSLLMHCGFEPLKYPVLGNIKNPPLVLTDLLDLGVYNGEIRFNVWLPSEYMVKCVVQIWVREMRDSYPYIFRAVPISLFKSEVVIDKLRFRRHHKAIEQSLSSIGNCKLIVQMRTVAANGKISVPSPIYRIQVVGRASQP